MDSLFDRRGEKDQELPDGVETELSGSLEQTESSAAVSFLQFPGQVQEGQEIPRQVRVDLPAWMPYSFVHPAEKGSCRFLPEKKLGTAWRHVTVCHALSACAK